jgi:hypothetical protein
MFGTEILHKVPDTKKQDCTCFRKTIQKILRRKNKFLNNKLKKNSIQTDEVHTDF